MAVNATQSSSFVPSSITFTAKTGGPSLDDVAAGRAILHRSDASGPNSKGSGVQQVQQMLQKAGFAIEADGDYGKATKAAVEEFQRRNGLKVDGKVGPKTLAKLKSDAGDGVELPRGGQSPVAGLFNADVPEASVRDRVDEKVATPLLGRTQSERLAQLPRFTQVDGNDKSKLDLQTCGVQSVLAGIYVKNPGGIIDIAKYLTGKEGKNLDKWAKAAGLDPKQVRKDLAAVVKTGAVSPVQMSEMSSLLLADMHDRVKAKTGKDVRGANDAELQMLTRDILTNDAGVKVPPMRLELRDVLDGKGNHFGHWTMQMDIAGRADIEEFAKNDTVLTFDPFPTTFGLARAAVALNKANAELLTQGKPVQELTIKSDGSISGLTG